METRGSFLSNFWSRSKRADALDKRTTPLRPYPVDMTGGLQANSETLNGLYYGSIDTLQFASPLVFTPINVPVSLVSIPTPTADDDVTKEAIKEIIDQMSDDFSIIERTKELHGTSWRWVRYDAKNMRLIWEAIPDDSITDIVVDPVTLEVKAIYTHEIFKITRSKNVQVYAERIRVITPDRVTVQWIQKGGLVLEDQSFNNVFRFMPIPFSHDCAEGEIRGHSVLCRILRVLKTSHDVELQRNTILAEFNPKLVHEVTDVKAWMANNGIKDIGHLDSLTFSSRFFLNKKGDEGTTMLSLASDATKAHSEAIASLDKKAIMGSGVPELLWGGLATGNYASTDVQMDMAIAYINNLRGENMKAYETLFNQSLTIMAFINSRVYSPVKMAYSRLDMLSAEVRSKILLNTSSAIGSLVQSASGTKQMAVYFWKQFYPDMPDSDIEKYTAGIKEMAKHKAFSNTDAISQGENDGE